MSDPKKVDLVQHLRQELEDAAAREARLQGELNRSQAELTRAAAEAEAMRGMLRHALPFEDAEDIEAEDVPAALVRARRDASNRPWQPVVLDVDGVTVVAVFPGQPCDEDTVAEVMAWRQIKRLVERDNRSGRRKCSARVVDWPRVKSTTLSGGLHAVHLGRVCIVDTELDRPERIRAVTAAVRATRRPARGTSAVIAAMSGLAVFRLSRPGQATAAVCIAGALASGSAPFPEAPVLPKRYPQVQESAQPSHPIPASGRSTAGVAPTSRRSPAPRAGTRARTTRVKVGARVRAGVKVEAAGVRARTRVNLAVTARPTADPIDMPEIRFDPTGTPEATVRLGDTAAVEIATPLLERP